MATHDFRRHVRAGGARRILIASAVVSVVLGLLGSPSASAAPQPPPTTSGDARAAWQNSSRQAEVASEQVNGAKLTQVRAQRAAVSAGASLAAANGRVRATALTAATADAAVLAYQRKLDAFANASFRGARLSQLSVMLTATSAEDFLDESTVMNRVAQDTQQTFDQAVAANQAAAAAKSAAQAAAAAAAADKDRADRANQAASAAIVAASAEKQRLDAAVATYQRLYNRLSAQEKAAVAAAAARVRAQSLAAAAAAQRVRAAAAASVAAASSLAASSAASSSAAAASRLAAAAPAGAAPAADPSSAAGATPSSAAASTGSASPAGAQGGDSAGAIAAAAARTKIGFAYAYGADGPSVFDCSGLTTWAWAQAGISIPRASSEQGNFPQVPLDQLQPGDLVTYYSPVSHVAIYVGNGMVVSAADESLGVIYVPVERGGPDATGHRVPRG